MFGGLQSLVKNTKRPKSKSPVRLPPTPAAPVTQPRVEVAPSSPAVESPAMSCSVNDAKAGLRRLGLPVTLFGESDVDRDRRLVAALELKRLKEEAEASGAISSSCEESEADLVSERDAAAAALTEFLKTPNVLDLLSAEQLSTSAMDSVDAGHTFVRLQLKRWLANWRIRLGHFGHDPRSVPNSVRLYRQYLHNIAPLVEVLEDGVCPLQILKCLVAIFCAMEDRDFLRAENEYFALTIGNEAWKIGIYSGGQHERARTMRLHRGTVSHIMNNRVVLLAMHAVKALMGDIQKVSQAPS